MKTLEFINENILSLICIVISIVMLIICTINGNTTYTAFWGVILIVNQNTLYFNSLKKDLEDK